MENDPSFKKLGQIRNVLTHREVPPRRHIFNVGSNAPHATTIAHVEIDLDAETTSSRRNKVARLLHSGLRAADIFTAAQGKVKKETAR